MGQKYVQADVNGTIIAFYEAGVNPVTQIGNAIPISDAQWQDASSNQDKYKIVAGVLSLTPPPTTAVLLAAAQAAAIKKIDGDVDGIYLATMGERSSEYALAESDANSYKTAAYPASPVPASVQAWATAKNWTPKAAADDIIAMASNWRTAQGNIRAKRLAKKEVIRTAATQAAIDTAMTDWASFVTTTRTSLGI